MGKGIQQTILKRRSTNAKNTLKFTSTAIGKCKSKPQWALKSKIQRVTNAREDAEKREHLYTIGENVN